LVRCQVISGQVGNGGLNEANCHRTVALSHAQANENMKPRTPSIPKTLLPAAVETSIHSGGWWS
jgi:hypothetical protein